MVYGSEEEWITLVYSRFQLVNKVMIRNSRVGPIVDEFAEAFAGHAICPIGELYSGYDQIQLAVES